MNTEIELPACAKPLLEFLHDEDLEVLKRTGARLGGGTLLAALWNEHRESWDLDIFIPAVQFDQAFEEINRLQIRLYERANPGMPGQSWTNPKAGALVIRVATPSGTIELIRDLNSTYEELRGPTVSGTRRRLGTQSAEEVLSRKIEHRGEALAERDLFDIAWAARHEPEVLDAALTKCSQRSRYAFRRKLSTIKIIEKDDHKPVVRARWNSWREEALDILREALGPDGSRSQQRESGECRG